MYIYLECWVYFPDVSVASTCELSSGTIASDEPSRKYNHILLKSLAYASFLDVDGLRFTMQKFRYQLNKCKCYELLSSSVSIFFLTSLCSDRSNRSLNTVSATAVSLDASRRLEWQVRELLLSVPAAEKRHNNR